MNTAGWRVLQNVFEKSVIFLMKIATSAFIFVIF